MKAHLSFFFLAGAFLTAAEPDWINEGFEVPRVYQDGKSVVGVEKTADGAGGWLMGENVKSPNPDALLAVLPTPEQPVDPKVARENERLEREALRESEKDMDREAKKKAEQARENAAKGERAAASLKTRPGQLSFVPGQKSGQSIVRALSEPIKAPFYMLVVLETDYSGGGLNISLEDEVVDLPFWLSIHKLEDREWQVGGGGGSAGFKCAGIKGRHVFLTGIEPDPKDRGKSIIRVVANPIDLRNPFQAGAGMNKVSPTLDFKDFVRLRITAGPKFSGKIDEIRIGKTLRDVLP